jgi:hypothetical protein
MFLTYKADYGSGLADKIYIGVEINIFLYCQKFRGMGITNGDLANGVAAMIGQTVNRNLIYA